MAVSGCHPGRLGVGRCRPFTRTVSIRGRATGSLRKRERGKKPSLRWGVGRRGDQGVPQPRSRKGVARKSKLWLRARDRLIKVVTEKKVRGAASQGGREGTTEGGVLGLMSRGGGGSNDLSHNNNLLEGEASSATTRGEWTTVVTGSRARRVVVRGRPGRPRGQKSQRDKISTN